MDAERGDRFVGMYVNELTQDYGDEGRQAVRELLSRADRRRIRRRSVEWVAVSRAPSSSRASARRSAATAARSPACGRTTSRRSSIREAVERAGVPPDEIEDVWFGCANQAGEDNRNVARMAALLAGLPDSVAGVTVNRLCASGLAAVVGACHAVIAGDGDLFVAGGVESMSRAPFVMREAGQGVPARRPGRSTTRRSAGASRTRSSRRCSRSSRWARRARTSPSAAASRARIRTRSRSSRSGAGRPPTRRAASTTSSSRSATSMRDEHPRPDTTLEKLAALKPAFREGGTVTAGNAAGINDGAAALVIASRGEGARARRSSRSARSSAAPSRASTRA